MAETLSRAEMEQVLKDGGSILHGGRIIRHAEHLPSEADLAQGDPSRRNLIASMRGVNDDRDRMATKAAAPAEEPQPPQPAPTPEQLPEPPDSLEEPVPDEPAKDKSGKAVKRGD